MLKDKIKAVANHPATGLAVVVALNVGAVVASYAVSKKLENKKITEA